MYIVEFLNEFEKVFNKATFSEEDAKRIGEKLGLDWKEIDAEQFRMGLNVEAEHSDVTGNDELAVAKIALAHIRENPKYYTDLKKVE